MRGKHIWYNILTRVNAYRRYSQIAVLASKLHFHPSVALPPKYALQPFALSDGQLCDRYEGLRNFVEEIFAELSQKAQQGTQHDVDSTDGLDMQVCIFSYLIVLVICDALV